MIKPELLEILACPKCKQQVELDESGRYLLCRPCEVKYPINEQDIPIMLIDEAKPID